MKKIVLIILATLVCLLIFISIVSGFILALLGANNEKKKEPEKEEETTLLAIEINGTYKDKIANLEIAGDITVKNINGSGMATSFTAKKQEGGKVESVPINTNPGKIWSYLITHGFSEEAAAGILGNLKQESFSLSSSSIQGNGKGPAAGLFQWEKYSQSGGYEGRFAHLNNYANNKNKNWTDLNIQLDFFSSVEFENEATWLSTLRTCAISNSCSPYHVSHKNMTTSSFKKTNNVKNATVIFANHFERAGVPRMQKRIEYADSFYKQYKGKSVAQNVVLKGEIKGESVTIKGTINGVPCFTLGSLKEGVIKTQGYWGDNAEEMLGSGTGIDGMVTWSIKKAQGTSSVGYSQANRSCNICNSSAKTADYDCSSFITAALAHNGMGVDFANACKSWPYTTFNLGAALKKNGWVNLGKLSEGQCKKGDILLNPVSHVELYVGQGKMVGASNDTDNRSGESRDNEVYIKKVIPFWTEVWRKK